MQPGDIPRYAPKRRDRVAPASTNDQGGVERGDKVLQRGSEYEQGSYRVFPFPVTS